MEKNKPDGRAYGSSDSLNQRGGRGSAAQPTPNRNALNGMGEFILTQVRRGASEQQWADWLKVPFEHACLAHDMSTVRRLLEAGVNGPYGRPRDVRHRQHTLLHLSSACGNTEVVTTLLRWGSAPDVAVREPNEKAYTPLHRAVLGGHSDIARILIKAGANKDARTGGSGATPLHLAARKGHEGCLRTLLMTGADKDARRGLDGATPLHQAAFFGQIGTVRELIQATADPNPQDAEGCTPVFLASQEGHQEVVVDLLRNGASPDISREDGWAPLHAAARFGHASTVTALLTEGQANYEATTKDHGSTPLHVAAISGFDEVLTVLLDVGSNVESADSGGWTPLHCACAAARASCVNALIARGADPLAMTPEGQRPASLIGTDLAEGDTPNAETNETIWKMLRVPGTESDARRRRNVNAHPHPSKNGGKQRPPPPYNDKPPPAYGPDSVGGIVVFDSAGSGSATGSASGSFSGSGSRQLHRSPTHPQENPSKNSKKDPRHRAPASNGNHHRDTVNGDRRAPRGRTIGVEQQQQQRRPRERIQEVDESEQKAAEGEAAAELRGYNPATQHPSARDKRISTGGVVGGPTAPPVRNSSPAGVGQAEPRAAGLRAGKGPSPTGAGGTAGDGRSVSFSLSPTSRGGEGKVPFPRKERSRSPPSGTNAQQPRGAGGGGSPPNGTVVVPETMAAGGGGGVPVGAAAEDSMSDDGDVVMDLKASSGGRSSGPTENAPQPGAAPVESGRGNGGGGGGGESRRPYDEEDVGTVPSLSRDGRRSSAGRASGGATFRDENENDFPAAGGEFPQDSGNGRGGAFPEGDGSRGAAQGLVANRIAAFDPFAYTQKDAQRSNSGRA